MSDTLLDRRNFEINGNWVAPAQANDMEVIGPSTEQACAAISVGAEADTNTAIGAAKAAFPAWAMTSLDERITLLENWPAAE